MDGRLRGVVAGALMMGLLGAVSVSSVSSAAPKDEPSFPFLGRVTAKKVFLRAAQSRGAEILGRAKTGETIVVVDRSYSWYKVRLPDRAVCYVSGKYVRSIGGGIGEVLARHLNIRARPRLEAPILGRLNKGDLVRILETAGDGWVRIEPPAEAYGWVKADFVAFQSRKVPPARVVARPKPASVALVKPKKRPPPVPKESEPVRVEGMVAYLEDRVVSADIRHQLIPESPEGARYLLRGFRSLIDGFLHQKVRIEGRPLDRKVAGRTVLMVTRIELVL